VISAFGVFRDPNPDVPLVIVFWLIVGGLGVVTGVVAWKAATRGILVLTIVLVVSLSAILLQPYNPHWLNNVVFWVRVYVAHLGLASGVLGVLLPRPEGP
jgi:hypothetical protein